MQIDLIAATSIAALIISFISIYLQWLKVQGPVISLLNWENEHRCVLLPYEGLPQSIQMYFPPYQEKHPGHIITTLVFGNSGDRAGMAHLLGVEVKNPPPSTWLEEDQVKASYYNFTVIPAYSIVSHKVVLRNIPLVDKHTKLDVWVRIEWGGPNPRTGIFEHKSTIEHTLKLLIHPGAFHKSTKKNHSPSWNGL